MKPIAASYLICLVLVLSTALGGIAAGRAAGMAVLEATLGQMVICADGEAAKTVLVTRAGKVLDLPHCSDLLCDDCLQAGAVAMLVPAGTHKAPGRVTAAEAMTGFPLHHPDAVFRARSRAPPTLSVSA